jgi:RNA polymerase sigma factor (sigma-70 family)
LVDEKFIEEFDGYITNCILKFAPEPIDDYKQDIYLILCEHKFHNGNIKSYLYKIIKNYFLRKKSKKIENSKELTATFQLENALYIKEVIDFIKKLPHGECLRLYSAGFHYKEIAEILHIKLSTVKSYIYRLRKKLQRKNNAKGKSR